MADKAELRLALVCYGGVSLAVYMHGVTKELHKLICAARKFDNPEITENPFPAESTEHVYYNTLADIAEFGRDLSVSIDIIGGTSAGGINGIALSKALARDVDMEPLKEVWISGGDIRQLLRGWSGVWLPLQVGLTVGKQLLTLFGNSSPLKGEYMSRLLYKALGDMERTRKSDEGSLLPSPTAEIELYVPTTDLNGFEVLVASGAGGASNRDRDFRQVLVFSGKGNDSKQFGPAYTGDLAFAGRASSSFPGAFSPVSPGSFKGEIRTQLGDETADSITLHSETIFLRQYGSIDATAGLSDAAVAELRRKAAADVFFVDGGVLDNAPFDLVIDAIARRRAEKQVYRQLVYIEPDPGQALYEKISAETPERKRQWLKDLVAVNGVRGSHPILTDLTKLRDLNWRIAEVRAISEQQENYVDARTRAALEDVQPDALAGHWEGMSTVELVDHTSDVRLGDASKKLYARAKESLGPGWPTYLRLRFEAVLTQLSDVISGNLGYPKQSGTAGFITAAWIAWARQHGAWKSSRSTGLADLLVTDMPYRDRRLAFILLGINALYDVEGNDRPPVATLDALKTQVWLMREEIHDGIAKSVGALDWSQSLDFLKIDDAKAAWLDPEDFARNPVNTEAFDHAFTEYGKSLASLPIADDSNRLLDAYREKAAGWTDKAKQVLLSRYLGFPLWDGMLFPTISLTELPQLTPIPVAQFSPINAKALTPPMEVDEDGTKLKVLRAPQGKEEPPAKLKGIPVMHFAAFFAAKARENDYLWGRLDGAELILRMLRGVAEKPSPPRAASVDDGPRPAPPPPHLREALQAVLDSEDDSAKGLNRIKDLRRYLAGEVAKLPRTPTAPTDSAES